MLTAFTSIDEDGRCPFVKGGPKIYLDSIKPTTHFAFAPGLGARFAALLPFPAVAGSCGNLLEVLRAEEGFSSAHLTKTKKAQKRTREEDEGAPQTSSVLRDSDQSDAADKDHFLLISACEPLDSDVFDLPCLMLTQYAGRTDVRENTLWQFLSHSVSFQKRVDQGAGTEVAQVCQLFRIAAFLQCEDLVTFCKTGLTGWVNAVRGMRVHAREGVMEGLVRKSSLLVRNAEKHFKLTKREPRDSTTQELLDKLEEWSLNMQPPDASNLHCIANQNQAILQNVPCVLIPLAEISDD